MARKKFTEEEMNHLRASPYVLEVSPHIVHFSAEFKKRFWDSILMGIPPHAAVAELGIDPDMLGKNRVNGLKTMVRNEARAGKGFRDIAIQKEYISSYADPECKIRYLEQQIAYKDQEIAFLKKIVSLGKGVAES